MGTREAEDLRKRMEALAKFLEDSRERDRELKREVQRALEKLRRLAAA